jgi:hypothetical protein
MRDARESLEERSLRRVRFRIAGIRTGWSKKTLRVPADRNRRGPQGKAAVESIVAGVFMKNEKQARQQK